MGTSVDTNRTSRNDSSSYSRDTLELSSVQSKSSEVYSSAGTISKISTSNFSAICSATDSV